MPAAWSTSKCPKRPYLKVSHVQWRKIRDWWLFSYTELHKQFVELIDDGGLAVTRISGNEHQLRRATGYDVVQLASKDRTELACSPVHLIHPVKKSREQ